MGTIPAITTSPPTEQIPAASANDELPRPTGKDVGTVVYNDQLAGEYINFICSTVEGNFSGMKIAYDGANGAAYEVGPAILRRLGAEVITMGVDPNGVNINEECGSTHLEGLQKLVKETGAHVGIANDGDADRCLLVDETGEALDGDQIMLLCALHLKEQHKLRDNMIVATVMSNIGFHKAAKELGMETCCTAVGDRYVLERMKESNYSIGGEQSGHVIFLDYNTTGDGLLTAVQTLAIVRDRNSTLSEMASLMTRYPQLLLNVQVQTKIGWEENVLIKAAIDAGEEELGEEGRILVRASGTEPLIRVMAEGPDQEQLNRICKMIGDCIGNEQGLIE